MTHALSSPRDLEASAREHLPVFLKDLVDSVIAAGSHSPQA
jgi:hypothetical protein